MGTPHPNGRPASVSPPGGGAPSPGPRPSTSQPPGSTPREGPARSQPSASLSPQCPALSPGGPGATAIPGRKAPSGGNTGGCQGLRRSPELGWTPKVKGKGPRAVWGQRPARVNPRDQGGDTLDRAVEETETCDLSEVNVALVPTVQREPGREVSLGPSPQGPTSPASPLLPGWGHLATPGSPPHPGGSRLPQPPAWPGCNHPTLILIHPRGEGDPCPPHSGQRGPGVQG